MRPRATAAAALVLGIGTALLSGQLALATPPVSLDSGFVTDLADVLSPAEEDAAEQELRTLSESSGIDLFVVFVDGFDSPSTATTWADTVAQDNGLGQSQYLLAVGVEVSQYALSEDVNGPVSEDKLTRADQDIRAELRDGDWAGAISAGAAALSGSSPAESGSGVPFGGIVLFLLIAAIVAVVIWLVRRSRRKTATAGPQGSPIPSPEDPYAALSDDDLLTQARSALVQADDAVRSSAEDLGFATAQFGEGVTDRFSTAVSGAKEKVEDAFSLQQKLDDEIPDSSAQRRAWAVRILQLCDEADELLDSNEEAFDALRKLEQEAPAALEALVARRHSAQAAVDAAETVRETLSAQYDASSLTTISQNPAEARSRLALADTSIAEAHDAIAAGNTGEAAFAIRTGEEAVVQAEQLSAAIDTLRVDLARAQEQAAALVADLEDDLATVASLPGQGAALAPLAASTRQHLVEARAQLSGDARRPLAALEALQSANARIDEAIAQVRAAGERAARAQQMLQQTLLQAQAQVSAANDFIATRRGAVGAMARTRAAEATTSLNQAASLQMQDPEQALALAQRSLALAQQAISAAENDVQSYGVSGSGGMGGFGGGSNIAGDILGGIIGGIIAGGGRGSSRGYRSHRSTRGYRPSGFGGSGGRRSRGGRF